MRCVSAGLASAMYSAVFVFCVSSAHVFYHCMNGSVLINKDVLCIFDPIYCAFCCI